MSYVLVTGGAGYIGSHTVVELLANGYKVVIVDNLCNSSYDAISRLQVLTKQTIPFYNVDLNDSAKLDKVFCDYKIDSVLHFAALKAVGESTKIPLQYYHNNVSGTISLLQIMTKHDVKKLVFSSSATVYGDVTRFEGMIPIPETCPTGPTNPYGVTKLTIENIMRDVFSADSAWKSAILRYFNPMGAHPSGLIGEDPLGIPNNLLPYLAQVAIGRREKLSIFGDDYASKDGTPIRDYIHVVDLAKGHIAALNYLNSAESGLCKEWNLGTGNGSTVFDVYHAFCKAVGKELPYEVVSRRDGDVLDLTALPTKANEELKWSAKLTVEDACKDLWNWTTKNPSGFNVDGSKWSFFGDENDYQDRLHTLSSKDESFQFSISNHGANIVNASLNGVSLTCGFDSSKGYQRSDNPFFGTTVGRIANRISKGLITVNNNTYQLPINERTNTLHGGKSSFAHSKWLGPVIQRNQETGFLTLELLHIDPHLENNFPGTVETRVVYTLENENAIGLEYESKLVGDDAEETLVSLCNHAYFNIGDNKDIEGTEIALISNNMLEIDDEQLPTGEIVPAQVETIASGKHTVLHSDGPFFDYCFVITEPPFTIDTRTNELKKCADAFHPKTKIHFETYTTEPSVQLYTGDGVDVKEEDGTQLFPKRAGFCLEAARYVDSGRFEKWRSGVLLKKGEIYGSKTVYKFEK